MRRALLLAAALLALAGCSPVIRVEAPTSSATSSSAAPATPTLSPDDTFLAALQQAGYPPYAYSSRGGVADVESLGRTICAAFERGIPYAQIVGTITQWPQPQSAAVVQAAHTGYCPQAPMR